jgi:2-dehydro-3-deoxygluconokinase
MKKIITLGEIMLRLAPPGFSRFVQADTFEATYGGGEANVAVSLANFGMQAAFVTKLPNNDIGQAAVNSLRRFGVDTRHIVRGGERVGIYFLEKGANQRASKVIYDRANSSIATAKPEDFDWDAIFDQADWFHFTGITPAVSPAAAAVCLAAAKAAHGKNIPVSCDLNYRKNLWTKAQAGETMATLMPYVSLCIANEEDAADVFGIQAAATDVTAGELNHDGYIDVAKQLVARFGFKHVAITLRESFSASHNDWGGLLYDGNQAYFSKKYAIRNIVDRVGGGDSFGAGLIYGMLNGMENQQALAFAAAASCLKHSVEGDFNQMSVAEIKALAGGDASGRVQR